MNSVRCHEVWVYSFCREYVVLCGRKHSDVFSESGSNSGDQCDSGSRNGIVPGDGSAASGDSSSEYGDVSGSERAERNVVLCSENTFSSEKTESRRSMKTRTQCRG